MLTGWWRRRRSGNITRVGRRKWGREGKGRVREEALEGYLIFAKTDGGREGGREGEVPGLKIEIIMAGDEK